MISTHQGSQNWKKCLKLLLLLLLEGLGFQTVKNLLNVVSQGEHHQGPFLWLGDTTQKKDHQQHFLKGLTQHHQGSWMSLTDESCFILMTAHERYNQNVIALYFKELRKLGCDNCSVKRRKVNRGFHITSAKWMHCCSDFRGDKSDGQTSAAKL